MLFILHNPLIWPEQTLLSLWCPLLPYIKHPMLDAQGWVWECPDVKNYKWWLNPVWCRMLYNCTHMATVNIKGLTTLHALPTWYYHNMEPVCELLSTGRGCSRGRWSSGAEPRHWCCCHLRRQLSRSEPPSNTHQRARYNETNQMSS